MSVETSEITVCGSCGEERASLNDVIRHAKRAHGLEPIDVKGAWVLTRFWGEPRRWTQRETARAWFAMNEADPTQAAKYLIGSERVAAETVADVAALQEQYHRTFAGQS